MISGAHAIIYTTNAEADRTFLRDVLALPGVDVGDGWLIFALPPSELAFHPGERNGVHELYLICDDVAVFVARMKRLRVACSPVQDRGWGLITNLTLPGGGKLGVYQARHARPKSTASKPRARARTQTKAPAKAKNKPR
jgi:catechol 2,3-dioxygenase-like lactoylglutathione lyase family enzyme